MFVLETERLLIRKVIPDDIKVLLKIYCNPQNMRYISNGKYNWTEEELCQKYTSVNKNYDKGIGIFSIVHKENGNIIGEGGLFNSFSNLKKLELGYIIDSEFWNNGFGSEICRELIRYAFKNLNATSVIARMYEKNKASVRLSEKCGMKMITKRKADNGETMLVYEILVENY